MQQSAQRQQRAAYDPDSRCHGRDRHDQSLVVGNPFACRFKDRRDGGHQRRHRWQDCIAQFNGHVGQRAFQPFHLIGKAASRSQRVTLSGRRAAHDDRQPCHHLLLLSCFGRIDAFVQQLLFDSRLTDDHTIFLHDLSAASERGVEVSKGIFVGHVIERRQVDRQAGDCLAQVLSGRSIETQRHEQILRTGHELSNLLLAAPDVSRKAVRPFLDRRCVVAKDRIELGHGLFHVRRSLDGRNERRGHG